MENNAPPNSLILRLRDGFDRIALVLRSDLWAEAGAAGLNPAQAQVLSLLMDRPSGLRAKEIAAHLAISAPSVADTLGALTRKGLISRDADEGDARAVIIRATANGLRIASAINSAQSQVSAALAALPLVTQQDLLQTQILLIRNLQVAGAIPLQRMCISCHHFRAHAYPGAAKPHHCAFIGAAVGAGDLRLDCGDHEAADPAVQAATWATFAGDMSTLQAQP